MERPGQTLFVAVLFVIAAVVCFAEARAGEPAPFVTLHNGIYINEHPGVPCPTDNAEPGRPACMVPREPGLWLAIQPGIYYRSTEDREHELEHVDGMRHSEWFNCGPNRCAVVTVQGNTPRRVGSLLVRQPDGVYSSARR